MLVCDNENMPQGKGRLSVKKIHLLLMWNLKIAGKKFSLITQRKVVGKEGQIKKKIGSSIKALHCWGAPLTRATEPPTQGVRHQPLWGFAMHFDISSTEQFNTYETNYTSIWYEIHVDTSQRGADTRSARLRNALWHFSNAVAVPCNSIQYFETWDKLTKVTEPPTFIRSAATSPARLRNALWHFQGCALQFNSILCNMRWITITSIWCEIHFLHTACAGVLDFSGRRRKNREKGFLEVLDF